MFRKPIESSYSSYADYACAAVGYAIIRGGGAVLAGDQCGGGGHGVGNDRLCISLSGVAETVAAGSRVDRGGQCLGGCFRLAECQSGQLPDHVASGDSGGCASSGVDIGEISSGDKVGGDGLVGLTGDVQNAGFRAADCGSESGFGKNHWRNVRKRENSKRKKSWKHVVAEPRGDCGESGVPEWRKGAGALSDVEKGFFSGVKTEVRSELQESRAARYIAENKLRAAKHEKELEELNSPVAMIQKAVAVMEKAVAMTKGKADSKVAGWARTVTSSYAEEIVKKASPASASSKETFDSFVWSPDASATSRTSVVKENKRELEYAEELRQLKKAFDAVDYEDPGVREAAMDDLKDKYADVAYDPVKASKIFAIAGKRQLLQGLDVESSLFIAELEKLDVERAALDADDDVESLIKFDMGRYGY